MYQILARKEVTFRSSDGTERREKGRRQKEKGRAAEGTQGMHGHKDQHAGARVHLVSPLGCLPSGVDCGEASGVSGACPRSLSVLS